MEKKNSDENNDGSQEYMDSNDFAVSQVSESGFSHSFRSRDPNAVSKSNSK
jgi:hypothetical protein